MAKNLGHIESLARSYTDTAIKTLAGIMMEPSAPARARIAAAAILLDRGWGKPKENVELPDGEPRQITHIVREIVHLPPGGVQLDMEPADEPADEPLTTFGRHPPTHRYPAGRKSNNKILCAA
jgi:hypothetical protein